MEGINIKNIIKSFGVFIILVFAVGILVLSVESNQIQPKDLINNEHKMTVYMRNLNLAYINHNRLPSEAQKDHDELWLNHYQQM
jgi:hypothetical protein